MVGLRVAATEGYDPSALSPELSLRVYYRERRVKLRPRFIVRGLSRLWSTFYRCFSPPLGPAKFHAPGGPAVDYYRVADELAQHYGDIYRSSFLANYFLGAVAVLAAMLGPLLQQIFKENSTCCNVALKACLTIEFLSLALIVFNFFLARFARWHDKFTNYRMLFHALLHRPLAFRVWCSVRTIAVRC